MKHFAALIQILATSTKTNDKLAALQEYFLTADDADKIWVIALFTGRRPRRTVSSAFLRQWCIQEIGLPAWLFEESYHTVGDLAETIALLLSRNGIQKNTDNHSLAYYMNMLSSLAKENDDQKEKFVIESWKQMDENEKFVFNKLITGGFRIGVSQKLMVNALAKTTGVSSSIIAHRIMGNWDPSTIKFDELLSSENSLDDFSKPYPFYLSYAVDEEVSLLGQPIDWQAEWKWDGIRGQIIKRNNELYVWSRGEELVTEKFPEYKLLLDKLPDGISIDGEIICLTPGGTCNFTPLPFSILQTRIGRKNISKKELKDAPVGFIAYDLLEINNEDIREQSLIERREQLENIF